MPIPFSNITDVGTQPINYLTGEYGGAFTNQTGVVVTISTLGRWVKSGNSQSHTLKIYASNGTLIDSVVVNCSGAPTEQFLFGALSSPVDVAAGATVFILSTESSGGDQLYGPSDQVNEPEDIGTIQMAYLNGATLTTQGDSPKTYGPVTFQYTAPLRTWVKNGNVYTTDGTQYQVYSALLDSSYGDIVSVPIGNFTWGIGTARFTIPDGVTLTGVSSAETIITMSAESPSGFSDSLITIGEGSVIQNMSINGPDAANCIPLRTASTAGAWRVSRINYTQYSGRSSYFINAQQAPSGLIDNCVVVAGSTTSELVFVRGPSDAWQNPSGNGDGNAVYVEDCTFSGSGQGYVCDANSNGKMVVRFTTVAGGMKVDGHGLASNGNPASFRGVRRMECYNNTWTHLTTGGWAAIEARGGAGMYFGNTADISGLGAGFLFRDYGYIAMSEGFQYRLQTPNNHPLLDQMGVGPDAVKAATAVTPGDYVRITSVGSTDFTAIGSPNNTVGTWFFATGAGAGTGTVTANGPTDPVYVWGNKKDGASWARSIQAVPSGGTYTTDSVGYAIGSTAITLSTINTTIYANNTIAFAGDDSRYIVTGTVTPGGPKVVNIESPGLIVAIPASSTSAFVNANTQYQKQQGSSAASFTESDIVMSNRDFYADAGFDSNTGVQIGTKAAMEAYTPAFANYGWWVTDEGSWNTTLPPNTSGQLYVWDGAVWNLYYTPYTYPHPLRDDGPPYAGQPGTSALLLS